MEIKFRKQFLKDLATIPSGQREQIEHLVFEIIPAEKSEQVFKRASKMKGYAGYYKIRVGDYRIGFYVEENTVEFQRVLHRKEIYRPS